ncbi:helix-hairpin-helix domain-containing protein [Larkinella harenae]
MKKVLSVVRDYFGASQQEARGLLALLFVSVFLLVLPLLYRLWVPDAVPDTTQTDQRQLDSLVALLEADPREPKAYEQRPGRYQNEVEPKKVERFSFDPNTIDSESWQRLGAPRWLADRIVRYRSKGGRFRKKEDLLKIYDFSPDLYADLEPFIQLNETSRPSQWEGSQRERTVHRPFPVDQPATTHERSLPDRSYKTVLKPFDINTADTTELKKLRGIGSKLALRIVKFRDALGGFVSVDQYREVFGLDSLALSELTAYGKLVSPAKKIAVNTATVEGLDQHVYLSRKQAQVIVNYRTQHGAYTSPESLRNIRVLDASTLEKLTPYLEF